MQQEIRFEQIIQVKRKKSKINNNNPFFQLIKNSPKEISEILSKFNIDPQNSKRIYINFDVNIPNILKDQGYELINRHLTIDQFYIETPEKHGLYPAHYTETYHHIHQKNMLKVHIYFNKKGDYVYNQVKLYENKIGTNKTFKYIELPEISEIIYNSQDARIVFNNIIKKRNEMLIDLIERSNKLESELSKMSIKLIKCQENDLSAFKIKTNLFISLIQEINNYSDDIKDPRWKVAELILKNLEYKIGSKNDTETKDFSFEDEELELTTLLDFNKKIMDKKTFHQTINEKIQTIKKLLIKIEKDGSLFQKEKIISKLELQQAVNMKIFSLWDFINSNRKFNLEPKAKKFITNLEKNEILNCTDTEKTYQEILELFKESCYKADLDTVQKIFKHIEHKINFDILSKIIFYICMKEEEEEKEEKEEEESKKILNFFYENSHLYKVSLPLIMQFVHTYKENPNGNLITLIFYICARNKKILLQTLINHGASVNGIGVFWAKNQIIYTSSIINSCLLRSNSIKPYIMKILLEHIGFISSEKLLYISYPNPKEKQIELSLLKKEIYTECHQSCYEYNFCPQNLLLYRLNTQQLNQNTSSEDFITFAEEILKYSYDIDLIVMYCFFKLFCTNFDIYTTVKYDYISKEIDKKISLRIKNLYEELSYKSDILVSQITSKLKQINRSSENIYDPTYFNMVIVSYHVAAILLLLRYKKNIVHQVDDKLITYHTKEMKKIDTFFNYGIINFLKSIPKLDLSNNETTEQEQNLLKSPIIISQQYQMMTCEPPPGSKIINGITIVEPTRLSI